MAQTAWMVDFRGETIPYIPRLHTQSKPAKNQTLPEVWIGFDSEAATNADGYPEVQTFQTHNGSETRLQYVESGNAFARFWSIILESIPEELLVPKTRKSLHLVPVYCHNWEYDFSMIVKSAPEAWKNQARNNLFYKGFTDTITIDKREWELKIENGHMIGNAPTLTVVMRRKNAGIRLQLLDTFPFFPKALATVAKDIGLEKGDRVSVIGVDWRTKTYDQKIKAKNEAGKSVTITKQDFENYAKHDAELVWTLAKRIINLHQIEGLTKLAVSGAGYAAKVMMRNLSAPFTGGYGGREAVQIALDAFHGGRSGRLVHGSVSGASIYDFRSSYPSIQIRLPALHSDYTLVYRHKNMPVDDFMKMARQYHGFARVSGEEHDARYPSLLSADKKGSIRPLVGKFENAPATVAEIYMGAVFGGLKLSYINEAIFYAPKDGLENARPFREFIERAWDRKNSYPKGTIEYDAAKIQANSGYGKMIEHRGSKLLVTDDIQIPLRQPGADGENEARNFFLQYHPDFWHEASEEWTRQSEKIIGYTYLKKLLNAKPEFGYYAVPQYAAWITGHAHARLVLMMRLFEAVKWDTDSVTTLLSSQEVRKRIGDFDDSLLPDYIQPLSIGNELGELDMEARNMSGVILGNKRYYLEGEVKKGGKWVSGFKEGHHGLPGVRREDIKSVLMQTVGEYEPKAKPIKIRSAHSWEEVGTFAVGSRNSRTIKPVFARDEKQDWERDGEYREFGGFS